MSKIDMFKLGNFKCLLHDKEVDFYVQEFNIPGISLGQIQVGHYTQVENRAGDNITWNPLNLTLYIDENLTAFKEIFNYIMSLKDPYDGRINLKTFDAILFITTNKLNPNMKIKFYDCWFAELGDIMLTYTIPDEDVVTVTTTIYYTYYEFVE